MFAILQVSAQPYQSMFGGGVDSSTQWMFAWGNLWGVTTDTVYVEKDTTVNGLKYKKIVSTSISLYAGLLREDTTVGKVWYRDVGYHHKASDTVEKVAYDFSLNIGDTFDISNCKLGFAGPYPDSLNIVDSVKVINGLKYIYFKAQYEYGEPFTIIEGIGSNMGIFSKTGACYNTIDGMYLLCSYKSGIKTSYTNLHYNGVCYVYTDVKDYNLADNKITIYPNPSIDKVLIRNNTGLQLSKVTIYDVTGRKITQTKNTETINVETLQAGYYQLRVYTVNGQVIVKPMVIQR